MTDIQIRISSESAQPSQNLYRVLTDMEISRFDRPRMPMVFVFNEASMELTREWQLYIVAINPGMKINHIAALMDYKKAFCNQLGTGSSTPRRDYILGENLDAPLPKLDKVRTCGNAKLMIANGFVVLMDGTRSPALKTGAVHPKTADEARTALSRYVFTPQTHPHLFLNCVTTRPDFEVGAWPGAVVYEWTGDNFPRCFMPHVSPVRIDWPIIKPTSNAPQVVRLP